MEAEFVYCQVAQLPNGEFWMLNLVDDEWKPAHRITEIIDMQETPDGNIEYGIIS